MNGRSPRYRPHINHLNTTLNSHARNVVHTARAALTILMDYPLLCRLGHLGPPRLGERLCRVVEQRADRSESPRRSGQDASR